MGCPRCGTSIEPDEGSVWLVSWIIAPAFDYFNHLKCPVCDFDYTECYNKERKTEIARAKSAYQRANPTEPEPAEPEPAEPTTVGELATGMVFLYLIGILFLWWLNLDSMIAQCTILLAWTVLLLGVFFDELGNYSKPERLNTAPNDWKTYCLYLIPVFGIMAVGLALSDLWG